jgi:WD40 repeat protein
LTGARLKGKNLRLWQTSDGELQQALDAHPDDIHSVAFSPDGTLLATSGEEKVVTLWRVESRLPQNR